MLKLGELLYKTSDEIGGITVGDGLPYYDGSLVSARIFYKETYGIIPTLTSNSQSGFVFRVRCIKLRLGIL